MKLVIWKINSLRRDYDDRQIVFDFDLYIAVIYDL